MGSGRAVELIGLDKAEGQGRERDPMVRARARNVTRPLGPNTRTAADCCGVRYFDEDGGVHVQPCKDR